MYESALAFVLDELLLIFEAKNVASSGCFFKKLMINVSTPFELGWSNCRPVTSQILLR